MKKASFLTLVIVILLLITATVLEKLYGTPWVATNIYGTTWFLLLWATLTISATIYIFQRQLYKRIPTLMLHLSFVIILLGAAITHYFGTQGQIHLRTSEEPENTFTDLYYQDQQLPFALQLTDFSLIHYPGTTNPQDYVSTIQIISDFEQSEKSDSVCSVGSVREKNSSVREIITEKISMNKIAKHQGYRFYQSSYDADLQGSILSVYHDPYGIATTYIGYFLLFASMALFLIKNKIGGAK